MAKLIVCGRQMTADQARDVFRADTVQAIYWSPTPQQVGMIIMTDLSKNTPILDHPAIGETVSSYEKTALLKNIKAGKMDGLIFSKPGKVGPPDEWDLLEFEISPQETKLLLDKPGFDGMMFQKLVVDGIRTDEDCPGYRQAVSFGSVDEEGAMCLHILVNAYGISYREDREGRPRPPLVSSAVGVRQQAWLRRTVSHLNEKLEEADLPVTITEAYVEPGSPEMKLNDPDESQGFRM